jgi:hypothetical protein
MFINSSAGYNLNAADALFLSPLSYSSSFCFNPFSISFFLLVCWLGRKGRGLEANLLTVVNLSRVAFDSLDNMFQSGSSSRLISFA